MKHSHDNPPMCCKIFPCYSPHPEALSSSLKNVLPPQQCIPGLFKFNCLVPYIPELLLSCYVGRLVDPKNLYNQTTWPKSVCSKIDIKTVSIYKVLKIKIKNHRSEFTMSDAGLRKCKVVTINQGIKECSNIVWPKRGKGGSPIFSQNLAKGVWGDQ